jgi:hypothetical protein
MNSSRPQRLVLAAFALAPILLAGTSLSGDELFIHRPEPERALFSSRRTIVIHGEIFGHLLSPSTFPSFNDGSGPIDRWNYGFRDVIYLSPGTRFLGQMVAHDDGRNRTKFDWHFSLRQDLIESVVLVVGHDSNHDSDHQSLRLGKPYYVNRNYVGLGFPMAFESFYLEPFVWFFHHTNQRSHLDLSGDKIKQETGIRAAVWVRDRATLSVQLASRTPDLFTIGPSFVLDVFLRVRLADWVELSCGGGLWQDREESPEGRKLKYHKYLWGIAIPF